MPIVRNSGNPGRLAPIVTMTMKPRLKASTRRAIRRQILEGRFFSDRYIEALARQFRLKALTFRGALTMAASVLTAEDLGVRQENIRKGEAKGTITPEETAERNRALVRILGGYSMLAAKAAAAADAAASAVLAAAEEQNKLRLVQQ